jgi:penicillin-binding protein 1C
VKLLRRFRLTRKRVWTALAIVAALSTTLGLWLRLGPIDPALLDLHETTSTIVVDRHGVPLYEALSGDGTRTVRLSSDRLPPVLVAATLAAEDRRFWSHPGVDALAMLRALRRNLAERQVAEGGSTITQQVAKLLLNRRAPKRTRGWKEKVREAVIALRLEHRFEKPDILAMYLNLAAYGNQVVGAGKASHAYFGRDASMLTPAQAAFLAGLPQRPSGYNPYRNVQAATVRQRHVIRRMEIAGALTADQTREAREERLSFSRASTPFVAPHFVEMVLAAAGDTRPPRIVTTLDAGLQSDIAGIIRTHRPALDRHGAANVAVVVLDNATGEWLAWEGSGNYRDAEEGGAINGPVTPRQPGSTLKPFTYALAFESGFTPASVLADVPSHFPTAEQGVLYSPRNYDGRYRGPLLARSALAGSENVPAVALASQVGVPTLLRFLNRAGLATFDRTPSYYGLGLTLGNAEVRLDQLVAAYSSFARRGEWLEPTWMAADARERTRRSLVSARTAYWITDILSDNDAREFIFGRGGSLEFPFAVAVKTGTSQAYHDNWTVGYTREVTVGVWVGNFNRAPLRSSSGVTGAAPIFHAVMLAATRRHHGSEFASDAITVAPEGLVPREVCALSGMPSNGWCPSRRREHLLPGDAADEVKCTWHHQGDEGVLTFWPPEYRQWAKQNGLLNAGPSNVRELRTPERPSVRTPDSAPLSIVNPPSGGIYLIDPTLRREFQTLALRAVAARSGQIEWLVNGRVVGSSSSEAAFQWPLSLGAHQITARDSFGNVADSSVTVK